MTRTSLRNWENIMITVLFNTKDIMLTNQDNLNVNLECISCTTFLHVFIIMMVAEQVYYFNVKNPSLNNILLN